MEDDPPVVPGFQEVSEPDEAVREAVEPSHDHAVPTLQTNEQLPAGGPVDQVFLLGDRRVAIEAVDGATVTLGVLRDNPLLRLRVIDRRIGRSSDITEDSTHGFAPLR